MSDERCTLDEARVELAPMRPRSPRRLDGRYVYVVQSVGGGPIKVGMTNDLAARMSELQVSVPERLVVRHLFETSSARAVEAHIHYILRDGRLRGEWFDPEHPKVAAWLRLIADVPAYELLHRRAGFRPTGRNEP